MWKQMDGIFQKQHLGQGPCFQRHQARDPCIQLCCLLLSARREAVGAQGVLVAWQPSCYLNPARRSPWSP